MNRQPRAINKSYAKLLALTVAGVLILLVVNAQAQTLPEYEAFPQASIGLQGGTQGFGLQGSYRVMGEFNVRVGFNTIPNMSIQYNGRTLAVDKTSIYALIDWQPRYGATDFWGSKWFVSTGFAYYTSNSVYRQVINSPSYTIYMAKYRPYLGTGLGNINLGSQIKLRADLGYFIPLSSPTSDIPDKASKVSSGLKGLLPGLNSALTIYYRF